MALPEPFGGLLLLLAIAVCFIVGIAVICIGRKSREQVVIGAAIVASPWIFLLLLAELSPGIDEWNRDLKSPSEAWGIWEGDGYRIELKSDQSFTCEQNGHSVVGAYRVEDWNIYLELENSKKGYMRFVEESGELLLLPNPPRTEMVRPGPITRKRKQ